MKGLYKYLSPFAPDQSGAVSVLYELGGIIVVCDAGGCIGNICGFDEPRWFTHKSALFSAGLRDMDAILGRDDKLLDKIADAVSQFKCSFIALVGTPVPSVIGTDFKALARIAEKRFKLPVFCIETIGMDLYDKGQEKAYMSLFETFASDDGKDAPEIGIIGATPLDLPDAGSDLRIIEKLQNLSCGKVACYGMGSGLDKIKKAGAARCNLVVSPSGIKAAEWLQEHFGTPYVTGVPLSDKSAEDIKQKIESACNGAKIGKSNYIRNKNGGGILIIHQQFMANELRNLLQNYYKGRIDVASWFMLNENFAESGDFILREENDLSELLRDRQYKIVAGDPLLKRAVLDFGGEYIDLPHYAVSGGIYNEADFSKSLERLKKSALAIGEKEGLASV